VAGVPLTLSASISEPTAVSKKASNFLEVVWKFSRPHTVVGSVISIISLFLFAVPTNMWLTLRFSEALMAALVPSVLMNLYITGLNQLSDIEIDKVNKPYLPLASGELSVRTGIAIVLASLLGAAALTYSAAWPLKSTVW